MAKKNTKGNRHLLLLFFLVWPIIAAWVCFEFSLVAFFSSVIFFGIPSLILSFLMPHRVKKAFYISLLLLPLMAIIDYFAQKTGSWIWPMPGSIFPIKFFEVVSIESLVWISLHIYVVIMFYQYFFEKKYISQFWDKRSRGVFFTTIILFVLFVFAFIFFPQFYNIPYYYLLSGSIGLLPAVILEEIEFPSVFPKLLKTAIYFFYLNLTQEIVALKIGWWNYETKQFIGQMNLLGVTFPFEEFFFWLVLFTLAFLSYYEFFFNREK
jgi:hypothetical protein